VELLEEINEVVAEDAIPESEYLAMAKSLKKTNTDWKTMAKAWAS
jgi:hypothetical protein